MIIVSTKTMEEPFRVDGTGKIADTYDLQHQIELRVRSVIFTSPGERVMRPDYGAGAGNFVFDVNDAVQAAKLVVSVKDALATWEPAVIVDDVRLTNTDPSEGVMAIAVTYRLAATGDQHTAVIAVSSTASYGWPT